MNVLAVGIGGFLGAIFRFLVGKMIPTPYGFPFGTVAINLLGCLFLAWFFTITANKWKISQNLKLAIGTGFTGAFTTFSTFSVDTLNLLKYNQILFALLYIVVSIIGGIGLSCLGVKLAALTAQLVGKKEGDRK